MWLQIFNIHLVAFFKKIPWNNILNNFCHTAICTNKNDDEMGPWCITPKTEHLFSPVLIQFSSKDSNPFYKSI